MTAPWRVALAAALVTGAAQAQESAKEAADPDGDIELEGGIAVDGRITRPPMPADLAHPTRWRYTPPGRIAPGNIIDRFLVSSFVAPVIFRDSDVGTGGGFAITDIDFRNQDYQEFANLLVTYTTEGQQAFNFSWQRWLNHRDMPTGGIIREERSTVYGWFGYSRTLTRRFYGIGSRTSEDAETSYTEGLGDVGLGLEISLPEAGSDLMLETSMRYENHQLSNGRVSDVPSTQDAFGDAFANGDGVEQVWFDAGLAYDTRDSQHQPYRGARLALKTHNAILQSGGAFSGDTGGTVTASAQGVVPVPPLFHSGGVPGEENPPTDVLAMNVFATDTWGDLPFYSLPSLGGSETLRGFIRNRFTDDAVFHGSIEYRLTLVERGYTISHPVRIERLGVGLFYDFGTVASQFSELDSGTYRDNVGVGLRISFAREASFRLDLGMSDEGANFSIRYGHAF